MSRLKLRDDAYYARTSDGACILTNGGDVVLTGTSIFEWIDRLAPYLDGRYSLAELTASMTPDRRRMTERVVTALQDRGVVIPADEASDHDPQLSATDLRTYRRDIDFLRYFGSPAQQRFAALRTSPVVIVGAGRLLRETVEATLCSGSLRVHVVVSDEDVIDVGSRAEYERPLGQRDPEQTITYTAADLTDERQLSNVVNDGRVVIYVADQAVAGVLLFLDRACTDAGIPFVSAIPDGDGVWLGPFGPALGEPAGWTSSWRRLLAMDDVLRRDHRGLDASDDDLWSGAAPGVVANQLVREVVRHLSGTADSTRRAQLARVELRTLRTERHEFLPHPFSLAVESTDQVSLKATIQRLSESDRVDIEEFSRRVAACLQRRLGPLGEVTERDFTQLPLAVSQVPVSDPVRLLGPGVPLPVATGVGVSHDDARRAAVLRGLATYGSLMVDPRRLHVRADADDPRSGDPEADLAALVSKRWTGFVWGHRLMDGRAHEVPATAVFPALDGGRERYSPPVGVAAGYGWTEAVEDALVAQCRRLTVTEIGEDRPSITAIEWKQLSLDGRGTEYRSMIETITDGLRVYDVTGSPGVPTLAFCLDGVTLAYASGLSFADALRDGLEEVLLWHQARWTGEIGYAPADVPPLALSGPVSLVADCPTWTTDTLAVVARLERLGWTAVAVPLDHDPAVTDSIMPYIVNLVLTRA